MGKHNLQSPSRLFVLLMLATVSSVVYYVGLAAYGTLNLSRFFCNFRNLNLNLCTDTRKWRTCAGSRLGDRLNPWSCRRRTLEETHVSGCMRRKPGKFPDRSRSMCCKSRYHDSEPIKLSLLSNRNLGKTLIMNCCKTTGLRYYEKYMSYAIRITAWVQDQILPHRRIEAARNCCLEPCVQLILMKDSIHLSIIFTWDLCMPFAEGARDGLRCSTS